MEDRVTDANQHFHRLFRILLIHLYQSLGGFLIKTSLYKIATYHQSLKQDLRKPLNHEVHFSVQVVRSEHISVLGADLLDRFQAERGLVKITVLVHWVREVLE